MCMINLGIFTVQKLKFCTESLDQTRVQQIENIVLWKGLFLKSFIQGCLVKDTYYYLLELLSNFLNFKFNNKIFNFLIVYKICW